MRKLDKTKVGVKVKNREGKEIEKTRDMCLLPESLRPR